MSRLVIVSNRVADLRKPTQSGGLAVGLADALRERGGVWFGWNGEIMEADDASSPEPQVDSVGNVDLVAMPLSHQDYSDFYLGYSNSVLWPLFHYRMDLVDDRPAFVVGYRRVIAMVAEKLAPYL